MPRSKTHVSYDRKSKLVNEKSQTSFLVAYIDADEVKPEIRRLLIKPEGGGFRPPAQKIRLLGYLDDAVCQPIEGRILICHDARFFEP